MTEIIAHINEEGQTQLLTDHLINVANIASREAKVIGFEKTLYLLGLVHDLGKADPKFQEKLKNNPNDHVNHSSAGAFFIKSNIKPLLKGHPYILEFGDILSYVITAHHGLYDIPKKYVPENEETWNQFLNRLFYNKFDKTYQYRDSVIPFKDALIEKTNTSWENLIKDSYFEFKKAYEKIEYTHQSEREFYNHLFVRLFLSYLKDADIIDTINAYSNVIDSGDYSSINDHINHYIQSIEDVYLKYQNPKRDIDKIRNHIANMCLERGNNDSYGIYRLDLPTGAGKTKASLRYALHNIKETKKDHLFYITPFLSVLEQNAKEIRQIIGKDGILEHHSNIIDEEDELINNLYIGEKINDETAMAHDQYLVDSWNSPVVLSTMVQFFNTLFGGKASNIRRFKSLSNSVIILDEVQSIPINVTSLFNLTINFISRVMQTNVVMCTATQPNYDNQYLPHKINYQKNADIVKLDKNQRHTFDRVELTRFNQSSHSQDEYDIQEEIEKDAESSFLIILNTKRAVETVYQHLVDTLNNREIYYLTTNLCAKHRLDIISEMKKKLANKKPIVCVSTQLIEAGVDIDFNRLIRSISGIDSIVQAMGRCNREGNMPNKGKAQLIKVPERLEDLRMLKDIQDRAGYTSQILETIKDNHIDPYELNDKFYEVMYGNTQQNASALFDYTLKKEGTNGYELLSSNSHYQHDDLLKTKLKQSFKTAANTIRLIDNRTHNVIVYYDNNDELIEKLIQAINNYDFKSARYYQKRLQPYTVSLYSFKNLDETITTYCDGKIHILSPSYYNSKFGVTENGEIMLL